MKASTLALVFTLIGLSSCVITEPAKNANIIDGSFIVTLRDSFNAQDFVANTLLSEVPILNFVTRVYQIINGFSIKLSDVQLQSLNALPEIASIEYDQRVNINYVTQSSATWGLVKISQREKLNSSSTSFRYEPPAGNGVIAYVIDTGIDRSHPEFEGRALFGASFAEDEPGDTDRNGHGTHVAGTIGSKTYGVAKRVTLVAVKVLSGSGSGSHSGVIAGIDWAVSDYIANNKRPSVINMSLGGLLSAALNSAVNNAYAQGVTVVVAAGNDGLAAELYSPASAQNVITVAASDKYDVIATFSNFGISVDIIAPGVNITSTWLNGGTKTISGTSMASPHVAGLAAYFISVYNLATPATVKSKIIEGATKDKIAGVVPIVGEILPVIGDLLPLPPLTVNKLAYNLIV